MYIQITEYGSDNFYKILAIGQEHLFLAKHKVNTLDKVSETSISIFDNTFTEYKPNNILYLNFYSNTVYPISFIDIKDAIQGCKIYKELYLYTVKIELNRKDVVNVETINLRNSIQFEDCKFIDTNTFTNAYAKAC